MDWREVPAFYQTLCKTTTITYLALRLLILTGVRSNPLRHIHKDQIDGDIWTIPAENMKGKRDTTKEFRVPLSTEALDILKQARLLSRNDFFFLLKVAVPSLNVVCHTICNKLVLMPARMVFALVYAIGLLKQPMPPMKLLKPF